MEYSIEVTGLSDTEKLANALEKNIGPGTVILLSGDLGAGKTTFTQFLGRALGVKRRMSSPTFNIIKSYAGKYTVHHMDCYRLEGSDEDLGFDEYFNEDDVSIVEWPIYIEEFLPEAHLSINIETLAEERRRFIFLATGTAYTKIVEALENDFPSD